MRRIIVTGVNGFVGHHLARELKKQNYSVIGTGMDASLDESLRTYVDSYVGPCDLTDPSAVAALPLEKTDAVINLAGLAQVGASFGKQDLYNNINVKVHTVLVKRLQKLGVSPRIIAVSTGAVYDSNQPMPLTEDSKLITTGSPYALSKIAMEEAMLSYSKQGMEIIVVRPFNHIGPGQLPGFLVPDLATQVLKGNEVVVGNLQTERDYTDVRDVVKAYVLLASTPSLQHRVYNVCSGKSTSGQQILETIIQQSGKKNVKVSVDQTRIRPDDPEKIIGDNSRLTTETRWQPTFKLEQTIHDFLKAAKDS